MLSINHAAQAIIDLINSRPTSPRVEEIAAIIAKTAEGDTAKIDPPPRTAEIRMLTAAIEKILQMDGTNYTNGHEAKLEALDVRLDEICECIWATPATRLADLQERAAIAKHWHRWRAGLRPDLNSSAERWSAPSDCDDVGDQAVAELILAVEQFRSLGGVS